MAKIEYCDSTINPVTGCLGRCPYCYARNLANGRLKGLYLKNKVVLSGTPEDPFSPRFWRNRLDTKLPKGSKVIFMNDMSDAWASWINDDIVHAFLRYCRYHPDHTFLHLTRNPHRYYEFAHIITENCWLGTTINWGSEGRDDTLRKLLSGYKFKTYISFEPLLNNVIGQGAKLEGMSWIIVGAQSHPNLLPLKPWVYNIERQAKTLGIPVFLKDNLIPLLGERYVRDRQIRPF